VINVHRADLIAITPVRSVPEEFLPFIEFKASLVKRELMPGQVVAIVMVESTSCYVPIFIDEETTIEAIVEELAAQDVTLSAPSEQTIRKYLEERTTEDKK